MPCEHQEFRAQVDVSRLTDGEDGPVTGYTADLSIRCAQCGEAFVFLGLPGGLHPEQPTCSFLGDEARLPIRPASAVHPCLPERATAALRRGRN